MKSFLRTDGLMPCAIPPQGESNHEIKVLIKEFVQCNTVDVVVPISQEIYNNLRGSNNLVFANSRIDVEAYAVQLSDMCEKNCVPNEFRVHHGSISKIERETVENDLLKGEHPTTAICTSTLELGVDIGKVKSIAQIGTATSVSGLRQRLGRSGRRNEPSVLRIFSIDNKEYGLLYDLRVSLVQNIAIIELMREHQYETPSVDSYHFSTLIQQILSAIAQYGGFYPKEGWTMLCKNGAFSNVTPTQFLDILKSLGNNDVVSQLNTGLIVIGKVGEKILKSHDFYAAFNSYPDLDVINIENSKRIGMIQDRPSVGEAIILSGRRWKVESYNTATSTVYVSQIKSGGETLFRGSPVDIDYIITKKMRQIYETDEVYAYLDKKTGAMEHLKHSRIFFRKMRLANVAFLQYGNENYYFTWSGTKVNRTIALLAKYHLNKECGFGDIYVSNLTSDDIEILRKSPKPKLEELASILPRELKLKQKYDKLLSDNLLDAEYASSYLVNISDINYRNLL